MVDIVVRIYPQRVAVHPGLVGNLSVESQCDVHVSVISYPAVKGWRVRISRDYEIGVRKRVITIGLNCVLGNSLNGEH